MSKAKEDVLCAIEIWTSLLEEHFGTRLDYAYAKGSAVKKWNSLVDYVPIISDLDIHIMMTDSRELFSQDKSGFALAIDVSREYEERFRDKREEHLHIPRTQVVHINPNLDDPSFFLPQVTDVYTMIGSPKNPRVPSYAEIRESDYKNIQDLRSYLEDIPRQTFDRVGLDFWSLLRRLNWRVSPTPIRLMTQSHIDPNEVWGWNRTRIIKELRASQFELIANAYQRFYETGWSLFLSNFTSFKDLRDIVVHGYDVLHSCLNEVKRHHTEK